MAKAKKPNQKRCPKGHRPPIVQWLEESQVYICMRCCITWKQVLSVPAEDVKAMKDAADKLGINVMAKGEIL